MLLLNFNFVLVCIIHKMLVLLKNNVSYLKDIFSNTSARIVIDLLLYF